MDLLTSRTTDTSYPTDAALQQRLFPSDLSNRVVDVIIHVSGDLDGATLGFEFSWDNGTTWHASDYTMTDEGFMSGMGVVPGWLIRPTITSAASSTDVTVILFP